ncbi:AMP-binding protein [Mycolicibacterium vaccae]|uniref:AMP-binding protein n=1 Tax=Mycolicibacterium vaccae TaxID=1810 RepID=UPI003CF38FC3
MDVLGRLNRSLGSASTLVRAGVLTPMRPDKYMRILAALQRENMSVTAGFAAAAQRCGDSAGLIDDLGILTWREIDCRADAFATALQELPDGPPELIALMARNHRHLVETLIAANRIGREVLLLHPSFDAATVGDVLRRDGEGKTLVVVHDDEFTDTVETALADRPDTERIVAWTDGPGGRRTVADMITAYDGREPRRALTRSRVILLTSGTPPKGVGHAGGDPGALPALLSQIPWRAEEPVVIAAPMCQAWGFSQLVLAAWTAATVVARRTFDPRATLELVDKYRATGLCVTAAMLEDILTAPEAPLGGFSGHSLRFIAVSGAGLRPDHVTVAMDHFGDVVYNSYHATETGTMAVATPRDLRAAPDTAGRPVEGTEIRITDGALRVLDTGEVGRIHVRKAAPIDGYTAGRRKDLHDGFLATGDIGFLDDAGRLFVRGRDSQKSGVDT